MNREKSNHSNYYNGGAHNGRLQKVTDALDNSFTTTYVYDDRNRLTSATSGTVLTRSYGYDDWGNLTSATMGGTANPPSLSSYTLSYATNGTGAPATNRINTITQGVNYSVSYDSAGNLQVDNSATGGTYSYDGASRLATAVAATSSYEYDGDGWRVKQTANSTPTYYLWSSIFGQPALELNSSGNVVRAYVFSSSGQRIATQASNGSFYWVHGDHLGSSHMLTDTSGSVAYRAEYDPHGNLRLETGTTTLTTRKFTGYERDAANLDFAQARTYGYRRGRFMQPDPLMLGAGDVTNPQSLNLYSYVQNDPINAVDPNGLFLRAPRPLTIPGFRDASWGDDGDDWFGGGGSGPGDLPIYDGGGQIDFPQFPLTVPNDLGSHPCSGRGVTSQLPATGTGFYAYGPQNMRYGQPGVISNLTRLAANWNASNPGYQIGIGDISQRGGAPNFARHPSAGHPNGLNVDIRPMRTDGRHQSVRFDDPAYSRNLTTDLIQNINGLPGVQRIVFNDSQITGQGLRRDRPGVHTHDNHLHVQFRNRAGCEDYDLTRAISGLGWGIRRV